MPHNAGPHAKAPEADSEAIGAQGRGRGGGGIWHKASVSDCVPLAAPIGPSPLLILTLCGSERVLVVGGGGGGQWNWGTRPVSDHHSPPAHDQAWPIQCHGLWGGGGGAVGASSSAARMPVPYRGGDARAWAVRASQSPPPPLRQSSGGPRGRRLLSGPGGGGLRSVCVPKMA